MIRKDDGEGSCDSDGGNNFLSKIKKTLSSTSLPSSHSSSRETDNPENKQPPPYAITSEHISKAIEEIAANRVASMIDRTIDDLYKEEEVKGEDNEFSQESDEYVKRGDLYRVLKTLRENLGC
jgi:hypothetical protein